MTAIGEPEKLTLWPFRHHLPSQFRRIDITGDQEQRHVKQGIALIFLFHSKFFMARIMAASSFRPSLDALL